MATTYKVLGQSAPANTSNADLYTVPAATSAVISTITVSNVTSTSATYQIYIRPGGAAASTANALVYNATVAGNDVEAITIGVTLATTDVVTVKSGTASAITFQAFGSELA